MKSLQHFSHLSAIALALLASSVILHPSSVVATPVLFPVADMFGGVGGRGITIEAANTLYTDGVNLCAGTYCTVPSGQTNPVVNLQPNRYLLTVAGVVQPLRFTVPASTNVLNVVDLFTSGPLFYFGTNGFANLTGTNGITLVTNSDGSIAISGGSFASAGALASLITVNVTQTNLLVTGAGVSVANGLYVPFTVATNGAVYATNANGNGAVIQGNLQTNITYTPSLGGGGYYTTNPPSLTLTAPGVSGYYYSSPNGLTWTALTNTSLPVPVASVVNAWQTNLAIGVPAGLVTGLNPAATDPNVSADGAGNVTVSSITGGGAGLTGLSASQISGLNAAASDGNVSADGNGNVTAVSLSVATVNGTLALVTNLSAVSVSTTVLTNNGLVWFATRTNGMPNFAAPSGSICTTTNGQLFVRSNAVWVVH